MTRECIPTQKQTAPVLEARGLTLGWDEGADVVQDFDLELAPGELVCIVGKSGCGKSTILHALSGLTLPRKGEVLLHGRSIAGQPGCVSYMLQKDLLIPQRTIIDNVCLPLLVAGASKQEAYAKAEPLFERFGLSGTQKDYPSQLSGGMRQRAALLRTYLMANDVVLMDEPFSALDALTRADMRSWFLGVIGELNLSCVLITHDVDEAVEMADRIVVLKGAPNEGVPTTVAGTVPIAASRATRKDWLLTPESLEVKKQVLSLLS